MSGTSPSGLLANRVTRRRLTTYVAFLVASVMLMAVSGNPFVQDIQHGVAFAFRPMQAAVEGAARDVESIGAALSDIDQLRRDNDALRAENDRLRLENQAAVEARRENDLLTGLLQLQQGLDFQTKAATVIARETSESRRVVVIDAGSDDGIQVGHVVIAAGGALVGRVVDVGPNFAQVLLISDSTSTVIGQLVSSVATGKVVGQPGGALVMQDVDSTVTVQIGEEVFTAGIELSGGFRSPYPKGLLIGQVVDVSRDPNEVVQTVYLQPAAPLDRLEFVLVITDYQGGLGGPTASDLPCLPTASGVLPNQDEPCSTVAP
ncbi:MAG TPA: rod shape-determining protein MreC [Candidatus Limnocylindrales bacterium]|nr:rod shape-determining protein MreC [Candidatus Limnocylindrales bacterium]